jgi:hypothetical protein
MKSCPRSMFLDGVSALTILRPARVTSTILRVRQGVLVISSLAACTSNPDACQMSMAAMCPPADSCPRDLPMSCPSPTPSYAGQVSQIIANRCLSCHTPGGPGASVPLASWTQVNSRFSSVLDQVYACRMPQDAGLPTDERQALLGWLVCMAPNN